MCWFLFSTALYLLYIGFVSLESTMATSASNFMSFMVIPITMFLPPLRHPRPDPYYLNPLALPIWMQMQNIIIANGLEGYIDGSVFALHSSLVQIQPRSTLSSLHGTGTPVEPSTFKEVSRDPKWNLAMGTEPRWAGLYNTAHLLVLTFNVNKLCQFLHAPTTVAKRVLHYLKGTAHLGILLQPNANLDLHCHTNVDWASCPDDCPVLVKVTFHVVSSTKQKVISHSSTECEYRAMANGVSKVSWLQSLLGELGFTLSAPPTIHRDNKSTIQLASNPVFHARTKLVEINYHFIREQASRGSLSLYFTPSANQVAECLTKSLIASRFQELRNKLMVLPSPMSLRGNVKL
uniref:Uncharacterized protein n=1 Tax=Cannabis sativa TaxID=3483 RepID=A0A803NUN3_CANSA